MNMIKKRNCALWPVCALAIAALLSTPTLAAGQEYGAIGIAVGARPELVEIEDLDGNAISLADYVGAKPLLIEFWATWCENCRALAPQLIDTYTRYGDRIEYLATSSG